MATEAKKGDFTSNLGRVYGVYTGGFLAFVLFIAILERFGVPNHILGYLFVAFTIGVYAAIGKLLGLIPRGLANRLYDFVARHRYRVFGRSDVCRLPSPEISQLFLP